MALNARGIHGALRADGHFVFETRRPERRAGEEWAAAADPVIRNVPGIGIVERRSGVTKVPPPYVSFHSTYKFASDGFELGSNSTLRFRNHTEVEETLAANGFVTLDVRDAPDRTGREYVLSRVEPIGRREPQTSRLLSR
jgi:hypothetical protein